VFLTFRQIKILDVFVYWKKKSFRRNYFKDTTDMCFYLWATCSSDLNLVIVAVVSWEQVIIYLG